MTLPHNECGQGYATSFFFILAPIISLELVKLGTSNFVCWLIQRCTSARMIDWPLKGYVQCRVT